MFWVDRGTEARPFLEEEGNSYSFADIFYIGDEFFRGSGRIVCLIACSRNVQTVAAYLGCLRQRVVPILIDANLSLDLVRDIALKYKAEIILHPRKFELSSHTVDCTFEGFTVYRARKDCSMELHDDLTLVLPTSGSTGDPKCVRLSAENIGSCTRAIVTYLGMDEHRVSISSLPLHYTYGLSVLHAVLESRSKYVLSESSFLDQKFWSLIEQKKVTDISGVPFMFEVLSRMKLSSTVLKTLKCVTQAGGKLDVIKSRHFIDYFNENNVSYYTMYGQTEASPRISYVPPEKAVEKLGSVGIPLEIGKFYTDSDDGRSEGELVYEGPNVCMGYAYSREDLAQPDINRGVLRTGDIATIDHDGYATIVGRKKRFVKVFGSSVNLDDLEAKLKSKSFDAIVIGKDELVVVVTKCGDRKKIKDYLWSFVNFPTRVIKIVHTDEIEYTTTGKPDYHLMAKRFL